MKHYYVFRQGSNECLSRWNTMGQCISEAGVDGEELYAVESDVDLFHNDVYLKDGIVTPIIHPLVTLSEWLRLALEDFNKQKAEIAQRLSLAQLMDDEDDIAAIKVEYAVAKEAYNTRCAQIRIDQAKWLADRRAQGIFIDGDGDGGPYVPEVSADGV